MSFLGDGVPAAGMGQLRPVLAFLVFFAAVWPSPTRADKAKDPHVRITHRPARGLRDDMRTVGVRPEVPDAWQLAISLGYAWTREGRPAVDPNGVALSVDLRRRFGAVPIYAQVALTELFGDSADQAESNDGEPDNLSRTFLGLGGGLYGRLGDFDLQFGATLGPLLQSTTVNARESKGHVRFFVNPSARLMRSITRQVAIGVDTGYLLVVNELDALWLQATVQLTF